MNKRITSLLLGFVMLFSMLATAVPAYAADPVQLKVTADKATAYRGDTVNYTVSIGAVTDLAVLEFQLKIPDGLTIIEDSVTLPAGIEQTLDSDGPIVVPRPESNWCWRYSAGSLGYTGSADLVLVTFACTVDDDCAYGSKTVTIELESFCDLDFGPFTEAITPASVVVEQKPVPVTGVTLDETMDINIGQNRVLNWTVNPAEATNQAVSFVSSNPAVAAVGASTGKVTGIGAGTATITITTEDGGFTDTCTVTVSCGHANKTAVAAKASDCKNAGWDAYKQCDDCGQLFDAAGTNKIDAVPFRPLSEQHTGGTATCTDLAVCTVCSQPYGSTLAHSYTLADPKAAALKTAGNCRDAAVYYYSCSVCGKVESDDNHTFTGAKDSGIHVGGTTIINASPANHKTQTNGYTGDTQCLGCLNITAYGTTILPGAHVPAANWTTDEIDHWKVCSVEGCGILLVETLGFHSTVKPENKATCQKVAVCDECGVPYGHTAPHAPESDRTKDATGHWYACKTPGCMEKLSFAAHTPDHPGNATEEYAIKCVYCLYEIEPQLAHTHVFDQEVATDTYKATDADCTKQASYYKSCRCGEKGSDTFFSGPLGDHGTYLPATCTQPPVCSVCSQPQPGATSNGHTEGTEWKKDQNEHWHVCTVAGCGAVIDTSKGRHTPDRAEATEFDPVLCSVCGYEIEPALGHTFGTAWNSDQNNHWNECACGGKGNMAAHSDADRNGKCDVCDHDVPIPAEPAPAPAAPASPKTGDAAMIWLWVVLLGASGMGAAGIWVSKKKSDR